VDFTIEVDEGLVELLLTIGQITSLRTIIPIPPILRPPQLLLMGGNCILGVEILLAFYYGGVEGFELHHTFTLLHLPI
jgi:hypothetical protein